jgi:hypothetical protein
MTTNPQDHAPQDAPPTQTGASAALAARVLIGVSLICFGTPVCGQLGPRLLPATLAPLLVPISAIACHLVGLILLCWPLQDVKRVVLYSLLAAVYICLLGIVIWLPRHVGPLTPAFLAAAALYFLIPLSVGPCVLLCPIAWIRNRVRPTRQ